MSHENVTTTPAPTNGANSTGALKYMPLDLRNALKDTNPEELSNEQRAELANWAKGHTDLSISPIESTRKAIGAIKPSDAYEAFFGSQKSQIASTTTFVPQSLVGLLQKKVNGARTRIENRKDEITEYRRALKAGVVQSNGKIERLTPVTRKTLQQKKLHAEAELMQAIADLKMFRAQLHEAITKNNAPVRDSIKTVREAAFVKRMAPAISDKIIAEVKKNDGLKQKLVDWQSDTVPGTEKPSFLETVKDAPFDYKLVSSKAKLASKVEQQVMAYVTASK